MSNGVTGEKPKKSYEQLGPNVKVSVASLDANEQARNMLHGVGKLLNRSGGQFLGSAAVHVYAVPKVNLLGEQDIFYITQMALDGVNEMVAQHALIEFGKRMQASYGRAPKTIDPRYKAEDGV